MTKIKAFLLVGFLTLLIAACGQNQPQAPTAADAPASADSTAASVPSENCVACHTDKDKLTETAKPEENAEGESKGVG